MFAPLSIHLDSLKKVFYDKNELMRSGIELNKNFLIYTNENENKDFFVGYLSNIDDGTGFEISTGLFLNRRISIPRTILEKTFLGNIELSDSLGFDGTKLKVITLDTLEATLEEEGLPASAKAIKLLKQEIDSFVAGNLPPATIKTIGGVIVGDGIEVDVEGTIRTPKSKNTKGSDIISNTGTTFLLNTGINVLNRNIDFDIEFSIINPSNSATKLFVSGSHLYVESSLSNFKGFSDGNITSVKGFVKDNLLHIYIENLCTSIVCDKIDGVDRDYPNNTVFVNKPFINKQELPIVDILKETVLNLKVMLLGINSVNDGLTVDGCNLALNTVNNLGTASSTKPLSANMGKFLQDTKLNLTGGTLTGALNGTSAFFSGSVTSENIDTNAVIGHIVSSGDYAYSECRVKESDSSENFFRMSSGHNHNALEYYGSGGLSGTSKQFIIHNKSTGTVTFAGGNYGTINGSTATFSGNVTAPNIITDTSIGTYTTLFSGTQQCGQNTWKDTGIDIPTKYSSVLIGVDFVRGLYDIESEFSRCTLTRGQTILFAHQAQSEWIMGKIIGDRLWTYTSASDMTDNNLKTVIGITRR